MFFCFLSPIIYLICKALGKIIVKKVIFLSSFLPTDIIGVVVITTAQLHSTKPEFRFCAGSNPARGVSEICDGEDLWQWSRLEIRLNAFRRSTIPQKQFINSSSSPGLWNCFYGFILNYPPGDCNKWNL